VAPKGEQSSQTPSVETQRTREEEPAATRTIRRPKWFEQTLGDAQEHVEAPKSSFKVSRPPRKFLNYMAFITSIIDLEPSSFEEVTNQQIWRDAMVEEYNSIVKNDV